MDEIKKLSKYREQHQALDRLIAEFITATDMTSLNETKLSDVIDWSHNRCKFDIIGGSPHKSTKILQFEVPDIEIDVILNILKRNFKNVLFEISQYDQLGFEYQIHCYGVCKPQRKLIRRYVISFMDDLYPNVSFMSILFSDEECMKHYPEKYHQLLKLRESQQ